MNRNAQHVLKRVQGAWDNVLYGMAKMYQSCSVRPDSAFEVFRLDPTAGDDEVKLLINPVVFNVPERATRQQADLFIVITGWLSFQGPNFRDGPLKTKSFGTEIGYFRNKGGMLEHVYGAHYDIDESRPGHPVFHAQIAPQMEFGNSVTDRYRVKGTLENKMGSILGNVRTPSAQMDIFSVITQICADHLMCEKSANEVKNAFTSLRSSCNFFIGAAHRMDYLNTPPANSCYRSTHWYAATEAR